MKNYPRSSSLERVTLTRRLLTHFFVFTFCVSITSAVERYVINANTDEFTHPEERNQRAWKQGAIVTSASGQKLCAKHRIPLVTIRAYEFLDRPGFVTLVHDAIHPYGGVAEEYCPNVIPESVVRHPSGRMRKPTLVSYCPQCQKEFYHHLSVPNERAAVAYATYVLRIGSNTRTTGPYEIILNGNVWTVRCRLVDGRRASIKFTKSDGAEISMHVGR